MTPRKPRVPKEVGYFEALVMLNDFIDNVMPDLKPAELKLALVMFRKTIGWNKRSEEIGKREFVKRTKLDPDTVKDSRRSACEKAGISMVRKQGDRTRYTWPMNERVEATLEKARADWEPGGKLPTTSEGENTPDSGGQNPPTQSYPPQSVTFNFGDPHSYGPPSSDDTPSPTRLRRGAKE